MEQARRAEHWSLYGRTQMQFRGAALEMHVAGRLHRHATHVLSHTARRERSGKKRLLQCERRSDSAARMPTQGAWCSRPTDLQGARLACALRETRPRLGTGPSV